MSAVVALTVALHRVGYGHRLDGLGGVLWPATPERFTELAEVLRARCMWRLAAACDAMAQAREPFERAMALPPGEHRIAAGLAEWSALNERARLLAEGDAQEQQALDG